MLSSDQHQTPRVTTGNFWGPVSLIATAQFLVIMNNAIINIALPSLATDLNMPHSQWSWAVTSYLLAFGSLLLVGGRVADGIGHRKAFICGLLLTAVMATAAGLATSGIFFLIFRAGQGAAAALLSPAALALLSTTFHDRELRSKAFSIYGAVTGAGAAVGLLAGGVLTDVGSWRWTMFVTAPPALIAALASLKVLTPSPALPGRSWNLGSITLLACAAFSFLFVVSEASTGDPQVLTAVTVLGIASAVNLAMLERRNDDPLILVRLFQSRTRLAGLIAVAAGGLGPTGMFVLLSIHMQNRMGMDPMQAGIATLPYPVGMFLAAQVAPRFLRRLGVPKTCVLGLLGAACGAVIASFAAEGNYLTVVLPALIVMSVSMSPAFVAGTQMAMDAVEDDESASAGAVLNSSSEVGGAIGVAALGTIGASSMGYQPAILVAAVVLVMGALSVHSLKKIP